ncbi:MAG: alpha/beta fold hydrolase [Victivallales bacterium]|nr:alpha/beta fold hydrolase [Victivallales bacterium]
MDKLQHATASQWYGFTRHDFEFEGYHAFVVEPHHPAPDGRWSWCTMWPEAFVHRVGVTSLLALGYHHAHIDVFSTRANPEGVAVMHRFHDYLVSLGLAPKVNLIGMSWGGFFSLRYAETYPQDVCAIYLDAPVCDAADPSQSAEHRSYSIREAWQMTDDEIRQSPLNPLNNVQPIVDAKIPIYAATGEDDQVVSVWHNFNILEERLKAAKPDLTIEHHDAWATSPGLTYADLTIVRRDAWGHHPHGFDIEGIEDLTFFHQSVHGWDYLRSEK